MKATIKVWSAINHTPITKRTGAYCDVLRDETFDCDTPQQAEKRVRELLGQTPHAQKGFFDMPEWENQNTRSKWISKY